ncbi:MAG: hypothetical protein HUJ51_00625 [Eggerthellaceae bacterium]|nr:hypothetical protein [Eggerthellaceae bacterium]
MRKQLSSPLFFDMNIYGKVIFPSSNTNCYGVVLKKGCKDKAKAVFEVMKGVYNSVKMKKTLLLPGKIWDAAMP